MDTGSGAPVARHVSLDETPKWIGLERGRIVEEEDEAKDKSIGLALGGLEVLRRNGKGPYSQRIVVIPGGEGRGYVSNMLKRLAGT